MAGEHFIKNIEIDNFKCFDHLKVDNLKRVNLLGGDNNVGKSAFLEVLEAVSRAYDPMALIIALKSIINRRQKYATINRQQEYTTEYNEFDLVRYEQDSLQVKTNIALIKLKIKSDNLEQFINKSNQNKDQIIRGVKPLGGNRHHNIYDEAFVQVQVKNNLQAQIDDDDGTGQLISYSEFINMIGNHLIIQPIVGKQSDKAIEFISSTIIEEKKLSSIYGQIVDMGMTEEINIFLREFDPRIEALTIRPTEVSSVFKVKLKDKKEPVLLSSMGEGLSRYIAIVCAIWKSSNGQLFIDEVENGIHYTKYENLWEIIFKTSLEANCQVFISSHSKECIETFSKVAEKYDHENIKFVNFSRRVDDSSKIVATVLDSVDIENTFELGLDVR